MRSKTQTSKKKSKYLKKELSLFQFKQKPYVRLPAIKSIVIQRPIAIKVNSRTFLSLQKSSLYQQSCRKQSLKNPYCSVYKRLEKQKIINPKTLDRIKSLNVPIREQPIKFVYRNEQHKALKVQRNHKTLSTIQKPTQIRPFYSNKNYKEKIIRLSCKIKKSKINSYFQNIYQEEKQIKNDLSDPYSLNKYSHQNENDYTKGSLLHWCQCIDTICKAISQMKQSNFHFISKQHLVYSLKKFRKFYLNKFQKQKILSIFNKLIKVDENFENVQDQQKLVKQLGQQLHTIQNQLFFKHKNTIQRLKYLFELKNQWIGRFKFTSLKFNLNIKSTITCAQFGKKYFEHETYSIAFLSLYLVISIFKKLKSKSLQIVLFKYNKVIRALKRRFPANYQKTSVNNEISNIQFKEYQILQFKSNNQSHYEQLKNIIINKSKAAQKDKSLFEKLVKQICYQKGYGFKCGVKIKNQNDESSIFRTIQKILENYIQLQNKESQKINFKQQIIKFLPRILKKQQNINEENLLQMVQNEIQQVSNKMKTILQAKQSIIIDVKDLLRGKCAFDTVEDIVKTVKNLQRQISLKGYQVVELKNRLGKHTNDVVLIINLPHSLAELQLVLKLNSIQNEFNHKIYELSRSAFYSPITNLIIHNKKWSQHLFSEDFQLFEQILASNSYQQFQFQFYLEKLIPEMIEKIEIFKNQYLKRTHVEIQKNKKQKEKLIERENRIQIILFTQNLKRQENAQRNIINRQHIKKQLQINFFYANKDFNKAKELIDNLKEKEIQENERLLILAGELNQEIGDKQKALQFYLKGLEVQQKAKTNDKFKISVTLSHIGKIYFQNGENIKAFQYYNECLNIRETIIDKKSCDIAVPLQNLGLIHCSNQNYSLAFQCLERCLKIYQVAKGKQSIDVANTLCNIGLVYYNKKEYQKALDLYKRCIQIQQKINGKNSDDVANIFCLIGDVYIRMQYFRWAEDQYFKSLQIKQKVKGRQSLNVANINMKLGYCSYRVGQYKLAKMRANSCLSILQAIKGKQSIELKQPLKAMGLFCLCLQQYAQSIEYFNRSIELILKDREKQIGKGKQKQTCNNDNKDDTKNNSKNANKSDSKNDSQNDNDKNDSNNDSDDQISQILCELSISYEKLNKYEEALDCMHKAYNYFSKALGKQDSKTISSFQRLQRLQQANKRIIQKHISEKQVFEI